MDVDVLYEILGKFEGDHEELARFIAEEMYDDFRYGFLCCPILVITIVDEFSQRTVRIHLIQFGKSQNFNDIRLK